MTRIVRSELVRLRRRSTVVGWLGLTALFTVVVNVFVFQSASNQGSAGAPPGRSFPSAAELAAPHGLVSGVTTVASLLCVISLVFWALATTTDFTSGLVRLTVQAEPRRWRLVVGKAIALSLWTTLATTVALAVTVVVAPALARGFDISTAQWGADAAATVVTTWFNLLLAMLVWGVLGLVIGLLTRNAGVAIGIGVGYALLFEPLLQQFASSISDLLPANVVNAIAAGGNSSLAYGTAVALGAAYAVVGIAAATTVFARRDVSD